LNVTRLAELNSELNRIVDVIIREYNPIKIILYGSIPSGKVNNWSDIDLVVIKNTDKSFYERLEEVIKLTEPNVGTDIIVYTPDEAEQMKDDLFFQEEIIKKGKVIFSVPQ